MRKRERRRGDRMPSRSRRKRCAWQTTTGRTRRLPRRRAAVEGLNSRIRLAHTPTPCISVATAAFAAINGLVVAGRLSRGRKALRRNTDTLMPENSARRSDSPYRQIRELRYKVERERDSSWIAPNTSASALISNGAAQLDASRPYDSQPDRPAISAG